MKVIGIELQAPSHIDVGWALLFSAIGALIGGFVLQPMVGGSVQQIIGLAIACGMAVLVSLMGASINKAGVKGVLLTVAVGAAGYGIVVALG